MNLSVSGKVTYRSISNLNKVKVEEKKNLTNFFVYNIYQAAEKKKIVATRHKSLQNSVIFL